MSTKILLIVALAITVALSQHIVSESSRCLCQRVRARIVGNPSDIKNMEIFPPSNSCEDLEIIVNMNNGEQYCLDPKVKRIKEIIKKLRLKRSTTKDN
ncbi:C-X-C motif chemokine 10 [Amia ocellicauda]|uniref:C-X-C motif chemokine 10 n=1 Tax=Amia ocellicauda TaxID=2972642 RepID=UPI0034643973